MLSKRSFVLIHLVAVLSITGNLSAAPNAKDAMNWVSDLATAQTEAIRAGKLILIHFSGDACAPCVSVQKNVFSQPSVGHRVNTKFVPVYINATAQPHIARQFQVASWPTDLVLTPAGQELHRMTSPQDPRVYLAELGKSVWRSQSMGAQVAQRAVAKQQVPQQRVPQPTADYLPRQTPLERPNPYAQQLANTRLANAQLAASTPSAQGRPVANAVAQVAPTARPQVAPVLATTPTQPAAMVPTQPTQTTANLQRRPVQPRAAGNFVATPNIATPRGDLYPPSRLEQPTHQLQNHSEPMVVSNPHAKAGRIPAVASHQTRVQQTNHQEAATPGMQLPAGKDPFSGTTQSGSSGPVMLNNPFIKGNKPTRPAQQMTAPRQVQPQQQPQMQLSLQPQAQEQPLPQAEYRTELQTQLQNDLQADLQPEPQPQIQTPVAPSEPPARELRVAQVEPTPALTPATPPAISEEPETPTAPDNIAMDGYCCVTLHHEEKWVKGDAAWGALHRGNVYLFHSADAQEKFLSDPDKYSPLLSGYDPVVFHDTGELKSGFRAHGVRYQDMTCLFTSEESLERFWESPLRYSQTATQAMRADTKVR